MFLLSNKNKNALSNKNGLSLKRLLIYTFLHIKSLRIKTNYTYIFRKKKA